MSVAWRDAYEREREERARVTEQLLRVQRREVGLPDALPKPREVVSLPVDVEALCNGWGTQASRAAARVRAHRLYAENGKDWDRVREILQAEVAE